MQVTLGAVINSYKQLKDRGFKITLETGELTSEKVLGIHQLYNKAVYVTIGESPVEYDDIKDDLPEAIEQIPKQKSPSQRLRGAMYVYWEKGVKSNKNKDFQPRYEKKMEEMRDHFISKAND